jgi:hypothetical protein
MLAMASAFGLRSAKYAEKTSLIDIVFCDSNESKMETSSKPRLHPEEQNDV